MEYQFDALVSLKFEFTKTSNAPETTQEELLEHYTQIAEALVSKLAAKGCTGHSVEISAPMEVE